MYESLQSESSDLTDFLNFFELISYFQCCGTLLSDDVEALLGYYLHLLKGNPALFGYIGKSSTSFEYLNGVLLKLD